MVLQPVVERLSAPAVENIHETFAGFPAFI